MDPKTIIYGETAIDDLVHWLRAQGEPQDIDTVVQQYIEILRVLMMEGQR